MHVARTVSTGRLPSPVRAPQFEPSAAHHARLPTRRPSAPPLCRHYCSCLEPLSLLFTELTAARCSISLFTAFSTKPPLTSPPAPDGLALGWVQRRRPVALTTLCLQRPVPGGGPSRRQKCPDLAWLRRRAERSVGLKERTGGTDGERALEPGSRGRRGTAARTAAGAAGGRPAAESRGEAGARRTHQAAVDLRVRPFVGGRRVLGVAQAVPGRGDAAEGSHGGGAEGDAARRDAAYEAASGTN